MDVGVALIETVGGSQYKNESCFPTLTMKERIMGWVVCTGLGFVISFFSMASLFGLIAGHAGKFAVMYTLGQMCSLTGTTFLVGPSRQLKNMCAKTRILASILYVGLMVLTLVCALVLHQSLLALVCAIAQFLAYIWYCLSYIPYARSLAKVICKKGFVQSNGFGV